MLCPGGGSRTRAPRVDVGVASSNIPGPELLDENLRLKGLRICNNGMAAVCARFPDRLVGLACQPFTGGLGTKESIRHINESPELAIAIKNW